MKEFFLLWSAASLLWAFYSLLIKYREDPESDIIEFAAQFARHLFLFPFSMIGEMRKPSRD
jgi:hypothetical protein